MIRIWVWLIISVVLFGFSSCMNDDDWNNQNDYDIRENGVFIVNEGNFMYDNASLSYYRSDSMVVLNRIFQEANNVTLGDVAQSMIIRDSLGYIVVNNSGKIYIINVNTFQVVGKITGLISPRYMHFISDSKAYVTDIYGKSIAIVNPEAMVVTGKIDVAHPSGEFYRHSTEQMVAYEKYVFVNCWSYDNQVLVIDTETDRVVEFVEVGVQPRAMAMDKNEQLWVITDGGFSGNPFGFEAPALVQIDAATRQIKSRTYFEQSTSPSDLAINATKDTLYFINGDVYRVAIAPLSKPELFIATPYTGAYSRGFSAVGIHAQTNEIYVADAIDNVQPGSVYRYSPKGYAIDTFKVGIIPSYFCFR